MNLYRVTRPLMLGAGTVISLDPRQWAERARQFEAPRKAGGRIIARAAAAAGFKAGEIIGLEGVEKYAAPAVEPVERAAD